MNVDVSTNIANGAKECDAWLLYISTDYVFDGDAPPYKANAQPHPLNLYGRTKLDGERAVRAVKRDSGIVRVGVLYADDVESLDESSVTKLLSVVLSSVDAAEPVHVDHWAVRFPTRTDDLAAVLVGLAERKQKHCAFTGTFHFNGPTAVTKYDMALMFARLAGVADKAKLVADETEPSGAKRPRNTQLDNSAIELMGLARHTPLEQGLKAVVEHYEQHLRDD